MFASSSYRVGFDKRTKRPALLQSLSAPNAMRVVWSRIKPVDDVLVAHEVVIEQVGRGTALRLHMDEVTVNQSIEPAIFSPTLPNGWSERVIR